MVTTTSRMRADAYARSGYVPGRPTAGDARGVVLAVLDAAGATYTRDMVDRAVDTALILLDRWYDKGDGEGLLRGHDIQDAAGDR